MTMLGRLGVSWAAAMLLACGSTGDAPEVGYTPVEAGGASGSSGQGGAGAAGASGRAGSAGRGGGAAGSAAGAGQAGADQAGQGGGGQGVGGAGSGGAGQAGAGQAGAGQAGAGGAEPEGKGAPYPIVLAHGFFGFEQFAGVGYVTYFYKVKDHLEAQGEAEVFTPAVDPFNDSVTRGAQLAAHIDQIVAQTGRAKVNLIGHSQGGLDARVAAHLRPDRVASITTFATPHRGTRVADVALGLTSDPNSQALIDALVKIVGAPLYDEVGDKTSLSRSLEQLSTPAMVDFNQAYPDLPGLPFRSFTGRSKYHGGGDDCQASNPPGFVTKYSSAKDPLEATLTIPGLMLDGLDFTPAPHDGLVPAASARWGTFLGCVPADHFDEIGQLFGDKPGLFNPWDYLEFYRETVKLLRAAGL